jgi:CarD family transcriptional regulator
MKFSVGDWVVHPEQGTGQITDKEQLDLVKGFKSYYKLEILDTNLVVHVPIREVEALGIRPIMSRDRLARVLAILGSKPRQLSTAFKTRQARLQKKLKTGQPLRIAEVIRDLTWRKRNANLSAGDVTLLELGQDLLTTEIAAVPNTEPTKARQAILDALDETTASKSAQPAPQESIKGT